MAEAINAHPEQANDWRRQNDMYDAFTNNSESEVLALIAYGLYKREKREWMDRFCEERGRRPTEDDLNDFYINWNPAHIELVKNGANSILAAFAEEAISQEEPEILRKALSGNFAKSIISSIFANVIYTLILIFFALILVFSGVDVANIFHAANDQISPPPQSQSR